MTEEISLENREKQLLAMIAEAEQSLCSKIDENNQLEAYALAQSYSYFKQEQPKKLQQVFADMESSIYESNSSEKIAQQTFEFTKKAETLEREAKSISSECEEKRGHLLNLLREVNEIRLRIKENEKSELKAPQFDSNCSQEVEKLARQFASTVDDVNEEDLISLLARGKSEVNMDEIVEKAKKIAQLRYMIKCETIVNDTLASANQKLQDMTQETYPNIGEGAESLSNTLSELSNQLKSIAIEEHEDNVGDDNTEQLERISELNKEISSLRDRLLHSISSDSSIPMPNEISNAEQEKEAMRECISVLSQSTQSFIEYLNSIDKEDVIDTSIATEDEIREELRRYNELKQRK